jgi:hypothetical protein
LMATSRPSAVRCSKPRRFPFDDFGLARGNLRERCKGLIQGQNGSSGALDRRAVLSRFTCERCRRACLRRGVRAASTRMRGIICAAIAKTARAAAIRPWSRPPAAGKPHRPRRLSGACCPGARSSYTGEPCATIRDIPAPTRSASRLRAASSPPLHAFINVAISAADPSMDSAFFPQAKKYTGP